MLTLEQAVTIQILHQQGQSIKAMALLQIVGGDKLII
ncbi:helix-turn-helix domain-containing protein, partial [Salmonella enterica subsp. enterica serovar Infantis]|nr:helix-turn-helix domain-containing protein [Salmonella enterica subsp. enterica serovar Infantis]